MKSFGRVVFALSFIAAGANHLRDPEFYLKIMPPYLPWHYALVLISGAAEAGLGVLLLIRRSQKLAAWGLIALLVAVFPANIHMAMHPELYPDIPEIALCLRLPLQGVLILWAYVYTNPPRRA